MQDQGVALRGLIAVLGLLLCVGCSRTQTIEFEMRWSASAEEPEHIYLDFMRFPTLAEIGQDEELQATWNAFAGDEAADSFQTSGGFLGDRYSKTHKTRRILMLSNVEMTGFVRCDF